MVMTGVSQCFLCYSMTVMSESSRQILNNLKKTVFYDLLNLAGRVFIVVKYSENVEVGNRGFLPEEQENGLILVFNSRMNFSWDNGGILAHLVFGTSPEKCFIPEDDIVAIYSPELETHFSTMIQNSERALASVSEKKKQPSGTRDTHKIVKVDFSKKKK